MSRAAVVLMSGMFVAFPLLCLGQSLCPRLTVRPDVEVRQGEVTLEDLLLPIADAASPACAELRRAAARIGLGAAPYSGSARILESQQIRRFIESLARDANAGKPIDVGQIPLRVTIRSAGATKSCADVAHFVAAASDSQGMSESVHGGAALSAELHNSNLRNFDCASAKAIPATATLELTKTDWNAALLRWEFGVRCVHPEDCVPFLVWAADEKKAKTENFTLPGAAHPAALAETTKNNSIVKQGQTASLIWDQAGIRIMLPVICLEGGGLGQLVRVRFKNAERIVRAEVLRDGTLRASL
jgi:hypothetical protein